LKLEAGSCESSTPSSARARRLVRWARAFSRENPMTNDNRSYGIDVSHYDLAIDWDAAVDDPIAT
jgi:GH25 family lysozyme M1 (1,4-beta-N-acetylmuramidase)